jgi:hypothetical protein
VSVEAELELRGGTSRLNITAVLYPLYRYSAETNYTLQETALDIVVPYHIIRAAQLYCDDGQAGSCRVGTC